jgi:copper(I)-binding protein
MNSSSRISLAGIVLAAFSLLAQAHDYKFGGLAVGHPYARATVAGQTSGGAFLSVANTGADDRLLAASTPVAKSAELHEMKMDGNVMHMRQIDGLALPAGKTVVLSPGSYHLMLMGLSAPLKAGDRFPMTLTFQKAGLVEVEVQVEAPGASMDMMKK